MSKTDQSDIDFRILDVIAETNEKNPLTYKEIERRFDDMGFPAEYKTIREHGIMLERIGKVKTTSKGIYVVNELSKGEAQYLADAVKCSRFLPTDDALRLIEKIYKKSGIRYVKNNEKKKLAKRFHFDNEEFFRTVETILEAIENNRKVVFGYQKIYEGQKLSNDGKEHVLSPYQFVMKNQKYYVIGYDETNERMTALRIVKIKYCDFYLEEDERGREYFPERIPEEKVPGYSKGISVEKLTANPYLFMKPSKQYTVKVKKEYEGEIIDWFGMIAKEKKLKTEDGYVLYKVEASEDAMMYWALQYVFAAEVIDDEDFRKKMAKALKEGYKKYNV